MVFGMILAGGTGTRMGADNPKQYLEVGGKAILCHTVEAFLGTPELDEVFVLAPDEWIDYTKELLAKQVPGAKDMAVIPGGVLRNDTIMNGIAYIESKDGLDDSTVLITHDAARPFVTADMIRANIEALKTHTACDTVIPATDTIVRSEDGATIDEVPNRAALYQGQTPQSFRAITFRRLYTSLTEHEKEILTDAAKVFVIKGEKVALVEGATTNIKVTYPSDLLLAQSILNG